MALNPRTSKLYVSSGREGGGLLIFNAETLARSGFIPLGMNPTLIVVNEYTNKLYVVGGRVSTLCIINGFTDALIGQCRELPGAFVSAVVVNSATNRIYMTYRGNNSMVVLDGSTDYSVGEINLGGGEIPCAQPTGLAVDSAANKIHVVCRDTRNVVTVDGTTNRKTSSVNLFQGSLGRATLNADGGKLYVTNANDYVSVVNLGSATETKRIPAGSSPSDVVLDRAKGRLYVLAESELVEIDAGSETEVRPHIQLSPGGAAGPTGRLALDGQASRVYVTREFAGALEVIGEGAGSDLSVSASPRGPLTVGRRGAIVVTVTNLGPATTSGPITVTDTLPAGMRLAQSSPPGWACNDREGTVTCVSTAAIRPEGSSQIELTVDVPQAATNGGVNTVFVSTEQDGNPSNNDQVAWLQVGGAGVDLTVRSTHQGDFTAGRPGSYFLTVNNIGSVPSSGTVTLADSLPDGLTYVAASGPGWSCAAREQRVTCASTASIDPGSSAQITLSFQVTGSVAPLVTNAATVSVPNDVNPGNNTAFDKTKVVPAPRSHLISAVNTMAGPGAGGGSIAVTAAPGAPGWAASSDVDWIRITSGGSGAGSGAVTYTVKENDTGGTRTGSIIAVGVRRTISQAPSLAGITYEFLRSTSSGGVAGALNPSDSPAVFNRARRSKYYDICAMSRFWGVAFKLTSAAFVPKMFVYDSKMSLVAESAPAYDAGGGSQTAWLPGLHNISSNFFDTGFLRLPPGEKYTLEITSDQGGGSSLGNFVLNVVPSRREDLVADGFSLNLSNTLPDSATGIYHIEDFLNADMNRHWVIRVTLRNAVVTRFGPRLVTNVVYDFGGVSPGMYDDSIIGRFSFYTPPDQYGESELVGGGTFVNSSLGIITTQGRAKRGLITRDFSSRITTEVRCPLAIEPGILQVSPAGGRYEARVTAGAGCDWVACSNSPWIKFTSASAGTGAQVISLEVEPNRTGQGRDGLILFHETRGVFIEQGPLARRKRGAGKTPRLGRRTQRPRR